MRVSIAMLRLSAASTSGRRPSIAVAACAAAAVAWLGARNLAAQDAPATAAPSAADEAPLLERAAPPSKTLPGVPEGSASLRASRDNENGGEATLARLREGTQLTDCLGQFRQDGELLSFVDEEGRVLGSLPNLSLERIVSALKSVEEPESVWWSLSGTVTEFNERNYILITRAVYKASALPPVPDRVE